MNATPSPMWASFVHPAVMTLSALLGLWTLRRGLHFQEARRGRRKRHKNDRQQHMRGGTVALTLGLFGLLLGVVSTAWLRQSPPLQSLHAYLGLACALLAGLLAGSGRRLDRTGHARQTHGFCGVLLLLLWAVTAIAGLELLP